MVMKLFDDGDDSVAAENDDVSKIEINHEFARRYEHNKKREDLQRLQELKNKGLVQSESESESDSESEEDDEYDSVKASKRDKQFFDALNRVKKQDPSIKEKDVKLFESDEEDEDEEEEKENKGKKAKAMYLKDVVAKHLIEEGPEFEEEEEGERKKRKSLKEEQEEIRREFLRAAEIVDGEGDLLRLKEKKEEEDEDEEESDEFVEKLDEYFGGEEDMDEDKVFLREFFRNRMWVDREKGKEIGDTELDGVEEDEMEIDRQEEYEYRFQENVGDRVMGHSRQVEGSVRKKVNARKEQRKSKEERMEKERLEREEELKHLKNLKKEEMDEKVRKIMRTAGIKDEEVVLLSGKELEEEFDPEEYDRMMRKAFGEEYYGKEDVDPEFGSDRDRDEDEDEKPDFDKEDELLGLPKGWDEIGSGAGFLGARERSLKLKVDNENEEEEKEGEEPEEEGKRKRKRKKSAILEKAKEAMMEEYYKLDYEDTIGDLKTRFKYAKTKPNRYGLSAEEMFLMDENELNQYVSLKKIAPYREKEWKLNDQKRLQLKNRIREVLRGRKSDDQKYSKKKRSRKDNAEKSTSSAAAVEDGKTQLEDSNGDMGKLSHQARRKQRQAEYKLSVPRLFAYGKTPSKSKSKTKH